MSLHHPSVCTALYLCLPAFRLQPCSAKTGEGLAEGLEWLIKIVGERTAAAKPGGAAAAAAPAAAAPAAGAAAPAAAAAGGAAVGGAGAGAAPGAAAP